MGTIVPKIYPLTKHLPKKLKVHPKTPLCTEFIAKQNKESLTALSCICVAQAHGSMGSLNYAPCMSSTSSVWQQQ
jgi:hypothetical protein